MRFLFITAAMGFLAWCLITEDGRRAAIQITSRLGITPPICTLEPELLRGTMDPDSVKALQPELDYLCEKDSSFFGDYVCEADIGLYHNLPAYRVTYFFRNNRLTTMRLALQSQTYDELEEKVSGGNKKLDIKTELSFTGGKKEPVHVFKTPAGNYLMLSRDQTQTGETLLLWVADIYKRP